MFADIDTSEDLGRVVSALIAAKEFKDSGDEVRLYFDGAGIKWIKELAKKDHKVNALYESVKDKVEGACLFCATAFGIKDSVQDCRIELIDEFAQHISVKKLLSEEFHILNF